MTNPDAVRLMVEIFGLIILLGGGATALVAIMRMRRMLTDRIAEQVNLQRDVIDLKKWRGSVDESAGRLTDLRIWLAAEFSKISETLKQVEHRLTKLEK